MESTCFPTITDIGPGNYVAFLYKAEDEHRTVLTPFLRQGLERSEKVLYIAGAHPAETILGYLRDDGLDVEPYLAGGQLTILNHDDVYLQQGNWGPEAMIALWQTRMGCSLAEGYSALRVTSEMTPTVIVGGTLQRLRQSECQIGGETELNQFFPACKCLVLWQYDRRCFDDELLLHVLAAYPILVVGMALHNNPCSNSYGNPLCKIKWAPNDDVLFVAHARRYCSHQVRFGPMYLCTNPVRKAIYNRYML